MNYPTTPRTQCAAVTKERLRSWVLLMLAGLCYLFTVGCHSLRPLANDGSVSVRIDGTPATRIRDVAVQVFEENGYQATRTGLAGMVFEKKAELLTNLAYGDWMGSPIWIRVKAAITPVSDRAFCLQCDAFRVMDKGASVEDEVKLKGMQSGTYQKLLDEIARRLNGKQQPPA